jgi:hypothetical protein
MQFVVFMKVKIYIFLVRVTRNYVASKHQHAPTHRTLEPKGHNMKNVYLVSVFEVCLLFWRWLRSLSLQLPAHAGSSLVDFFYPEDGGDTFLRNFG